MTLRARPVLDVRVARALDRGGLVDITTHGRQTGQARRIELVFHNFEDRIYITYDLDLMVASAPLVEVTFASGVR